MNTAEGLRFEVVPATDGMCGFDIYDDEGELVAFVTDEYSPELDGFPDYVRIRVADLSPRRRTA